MREVNDKVKSIFDNEEVVKRYHDILYPENNGIVNRKDLQSIINDCGIKYLYKYRQGSEQDFNNIIKNQIILASPDKFNDSYEFRYSYSYELFKKECEKRLYDAKIIKNIYQNKNIPYNDKENIVKHLYNKFTDDINRKKKDWLVLCLCEQYDNSLMWSHYGNSNEGICIEYDFGELNSTNDIAPVIYADKFVTFNSRNISRKEFSKVLYTKLKVNWFYEREWRIVKTDKSNGLIDVFDNNNIIIDGVKLMKTPKIKSLYIGCKAKADVINRAKKYIKYNPDVNLYVMKMDNFLNTLYKEKINLL